MAKAHQYEHVEDFLEQYQSSVELQGWIAYEKLEDELQKNRLIYAFGKVMYSDRKQQPTAPAGEKPIDTTDPEFAKHFKGLNYTKPQQQKFKQAPVSTEIKIG